MKKRYLVIGLLALSMVVAFLAVACGGTEETTTTQATGPVTVGHIVDLTGYQQNVGPIFKAGLDYALKDATIGDLGSQIAAIIVHVRNVP